MERLIIKRAVLRGVEELGFFGGGVLSIEFILRGNLVEGGVVGGVSIVSKAVPTAVRKIGEVRQRNKQ